MGKGALEFVAIGSFQSYFGASNAWFIGVLQAIGVQVVPNATQDNSFAVIGIVIRVFIEKIWNAVVIAVGGIIQSGKAGIQADDVEGEFSCFSISTNGFKYIGFAIGGFRVTIFFLIADGLSAGKVGCKGRKVII